MSRLDSFIRRVTAQRDCLNAAAVLVRDLPGPVLEFGLGNGRTYDHLRSLLPDRQIFVFERQVAAHPDCIPPDEPPPCATCGRHAFSRPDEPILDAASLPADLDLFRVGNFATMIIGTERFMDAVRRMELDGITFRELPTR